MRPAPKVLPVVREMVGLVFDKVTRRDAHTRPVVEFDALRHARWREMVEDAHRLTWDDLHDVFPDDEDEVA